jgi:hypothetical protein
LTAVEFSTDERDLLLAGQFELRITDAEDVEKAVQIEALVVKFDADPDAVCFGGYKDTHGAVPVPEYPPDESDEG